MPAICQSTIVGDYQTQAIDHQNKRPTSTVHFNGIMMASSLLSGASIIKLWFFKSYAVLWKSVCRWQDRAEVLKCFSKFTQRHIVTMRVGIQNKPNKSGCNICNQKSARILLFARTVVLLSFCANDSSWITVATMNSVVPASLYTGIHKESAFVSSTTSEVQFVRL